MSKRLQVVMDEVELREIKRAARRNRMTVAEWVRQALRAARRQESHVPADRKIHVVREAVRHDYPTGSIEEMLGDIQRGYLEESS